MNGGGTTSLYDQGETRVALGDGVPDLSFILPRAAHAALFVEEPEDMAVGAESMIVTNRDGVASAENRRECA
jgi:hypothetical protein